MEGNIDHCDTELCLSPASHRYRHSSRSNCSGSTSRVEEKAVKASQKQQIAMFFGGRICVCDITEIQARAIICTAKREMEARKHNHQQSSQDMQESSSSLPQLWPQSKSTQLQLLNPDLSMKRSLQRFLQKRRSRTFNSSPYNHHHEQLPS